MIEKILNQLMIFVASEEWIPVKNIRLKFYEETYKEIWKILNEAQGLGIMIKDHNYSKYINVDNIITNILFVDPRRDYTIAYCLQRKAWGKESFIVYGINHPQDNSDKNLNMVNLDEILFFCPKYVTKKFIGY